MNLVITPTVGASQYTLERLRTYGNRFDFGPEVRLAHLPGIGTCKLFMAEGYKWLGWLPIDEIDIIPALDAPIPVR